MKRLESINNKKFQLSDSEMLQIKGGYDDGSITYSYCEEDTQQPNGGAICDVRDCDRCIDF